MAGVFDPHDENLSEAVETAFPLHTECALMVWHHNHIARKRSRLAQAAWDTCREFRGRVRLASTSRT